jgi:hypothetical protein
MTEELRDDNGKPFPTIVPDRPEASKTVTLSDVFDLINTFDEKDISKRDLTRAVENLAAA